MNSKRETSDTNLVQVRKHVFGVWILLMTLSSLVCHCAAQAETLKEQVEILQGQLRQKIMPYWYDTAQDRDRGGYLLADRLDGRGQAKEKQLVTQSRMVWGFSHAHILGLSDHERKYLQAAKQGYEFLIKHFRDSRRGGYYWSTDLAGNVLNDRKIVYGNAFVIYALVEYHRASRDPEPLELALELYYSLQKDAHDPNHAGWIEHFHADWRPILAPHPQAPVEVPGLKSANTHLHLMEAFAELYLVTKHPMVKLSLIEALEINQRFFYPLTAADACFHRHLDWRKVTDQASAGLSYGHNVEFAWLMVHAEKALGRAPSWDQFYAHLNHALACGYDYEIGGLYYRGIGAQAATGKEKSWWVQAEMLAVLNDALAHQANPTYASILAQMFNFIQKYQLDPRDAIWLESINPDGTVKSAAKAHNWKANYHDVRAISKLIKTVHR
jgi:mannose/cellobiose epimerase-like protein (N-acyl-D-glucosamine 2-epimerase family)